MNQPHSTVLPPISRPLGALLPGIAVASLVALLAYGAAPYIATVAPIPAMVVALLLGVALSPATGATVQPGLDFCVRSVLRWSVGLMGLRVGLSDITGLGVSPAIIVIGSMIATVACGFALAPIAKRPAGFGALIGVGTAVCGASATLAVSAVVPDYKDKQADIVFTVVAVNALATVAMLVYPPLCAALKFDPQTTGIMLGGTIHDVAQVAGAGYAISTVTGNTAVIVKLFRIFLLLPTVLAVGLYLNRKNATEGASRIPVPGFAICFLLFCAINSAAPLFPSITPTYEAVRPVLIDVSTAGLLVAIAALGLGTSIAAITRLGWRHMIPVIGTSLVILVLVTGALLITT